MRPIQQQYREQAGAIAVLGGSSDPARIGTAFDFMIRELLDPEYVPQVALQGFPPAAHARIAEVAETAGISALHALADPEKAAMLAKAAPSASPRRKC
ncbi:hypothetical protein [Nocardia sp. NPDC051832]|uniref:hypothetical protein n=1 Tax=Nocardia sp. NPDC051832 TaxID=3155673 RepID=UPI00342EBE32